MIIFVGDKPSVKNIDQNIPFVGTQSYKVLLRWIWEMDLSINDIQIANKDTIDTYEIVDGTKEIKFNGEYFYHRDVQVVALGHNASKKLTDSGIEHFKLPHPSGSNRKLNDTKWLEQQLEECKQWLGKGGL